MRSSGIAWICKASSEVSFKRTITWFSSAMSPTFISFIIEENMEAAALASGLPSRPAQLSDPQARLTKVTSSSVSGDCFIFILSLPSSMVSIRSSTNAFMSTKSVSPFRRKRLPLKLTPFSSIFSILPKVNFCCSCFIFASWTTSPNMRRSSISTATIPCNTQASSPPHSFAPSLGP